MKPLDETMTRYPYKQLIHLDIFYQGKLSFKHTLPTLTCFTPQPSDEPNTTPYTTLLTNKQDVFTMTKNNQDTHLKSRNSKPIEEKTLKCHILYKNHIYKWCFKNQRDLTIQLYK